MARPGFSLDRKFKRLARALDEFQRGFGDILARGCLELLWDSAYEACDDYLGDATDVEALAGWRGPVNVLVPALRDAGGDDKAGFIEEGGSRWWPEGKPGTYRIHDLWDHAPDYAQKRLAREEERERKGKSIKELRAEAGRKGAAATNGKRQAAVRPPGGNWPPDDGQSAAGVRQDAGTLTLAPAPAPTQQEAGSGSAADPDALIAAFRGSLGSAVGQPPDWFRLAAPENVAETRRMLGEELARLGVERAAAVAAERARKAGKVNRWLRWYLGALQDETVAAPASAPEPPPEPDPGCPEWAEARETVRGRVRHDLWDRFFRGLRGRIDGDTLDLAVPGRDYDAAFMTDNYAGFLAEVAGRPVRFHAEVADGSG